MARIFWKWLSSIIRKKCPLVSAPARLPSISTCFGWVAHLYVLCKGGSARPSVTAFCWRGGVDFARVHASRSLLRQSRSALHQLQLLSAAAVVGRSAAARFVSDCAGRSSPALRLRRRGLRGHARSHPPADWRAGEGQSLESDASHQTGFCAASFEIAAPAAGRGAAGVIRHRRGARVAEAFLRFQRMDSAQADREVALYARESCKAGAGAGTGAVAVEQLPELCFGEPGAVRINQWRKAEMKIPPQAA